MDEGTVGIIVSEKAIECEEDQPNEGGVTKKEGAG